MSTTTETKIESHSILSRHHVFNGDAEQFSWWKTKLYSFVITQDEDLWDVIEDGCSVSVNKYGVSLNRKAKKKCIILILSSQSYITCFILKSCIHTLGVCF